MKKSILSNVLSKKNAHERDKNIQFFEEGHKYIVLFEPEIKYTSVTTWNHSHFPHFNADEIITKMMKSKGWKEGHKYWGLTAEQIKAQWNANGASVSSLGTELHYEIECFMNNKIMEKLGIDYTNKDLYDHYVITNKNNNINQSLEWNYFIQFIKDFPDLKPYRTEWIIYNEDLKISGSIDMVFENVDGTLSIYDWKRCKNITRINNFNQFALTPEICHFPDSNFWHYALQLNTYKSILESKYDKKIKDLFLVRLHPDKINNDENEDEKEEENNYELISLPILTKEINDLFTKRMKQITNN